MTPRQRIYSIALLLGAVVILYIGVYGLQRKIDLKERISLSERILLTLPSGDYMRSATIGFEAIVADLIWAHTVVTFGERLVTTQDYTGLNDALNIIIVLDPLFREAYQFGSIMLAMQAEEVDQAITLLEKGIEKHSDDWRLPFIMGFYYTHYKADDQKALDYFARAADLPGPPRYLPRLIGNLYAKTGKIDLALAFLSDAYEQFTDEDMRAEIKEKIDGLIVEKHVVILEEVAERYRSTYRSYPDGLDDLVKANLITAIPQEPRGGRYIIDSQTGQVTSHKLLLSLKVEFQKELDNRVVSNSFIQKFEDNQISLSRSVIISIEEASKAWWLTDEENEQLYFVSQAENLLNVYNVKGD